MTEDGRQQIATLTAELQKKESELAKAQVGIDCFVHLVFFISSRIITVIIFY